MVETKSVESLEKQVKQLKSEISDLKIASSLSLETLNSSVDAIVRYDAEGFVQYLNPAFTKLFGWTFQELKGKRVDFVPEEAQERTQEAIRRIKTGEEITNFPTKRSTRDGRILDVSMSVASIYDDEENNIGNVVTFRDEAQRQQMKDDLQKTKDEYIQLSNKSVDAVVRYDAQGFVQYLNPAFTKLFGWTFKELKGKRVDFVPDEAQESTMEAIRRLKAGEESTNFQTKRLTRDGRILDVSISVASIYNNKEENISNVVIIRDETQRQQMENDLRKTKDEYMQLFNASVDAIVRYDAQGLVQYLNPAFTRLFGWTFDELKGKRVDFVPEEARESTHEAIRRIKEGEEITNFPTKRSTKDGQILNVSMSVASIYDDEENNIGNVVIVRDETQRQKMEDNLRKTKDEYIQLFNASVDAIVRYDAQGFVQYLNPAFTKLFGWTFEELKGKRVDFVPEEVLEDTLELVNKMKLRESISNFPTLRMTKDGRKLNVALSTSSIADEEGNNIGNVVIFRDETERKKAEVALQKAISEKAANQLKSKFLANMSHEIRTPMNGIMGMANLMLDTSLDDDQLDYMKIIRNSSDALLSIINDILDFSKIEAGKMEMEMLDFDLRRSLDEIINIPAVASREKGLELCYEINHEVPSLIVGDPGRLRQIIINLLNNAIKFTSEGEIVLRVSLKEESDTHVLLQFIVKDTGIGISKNDISGLFQTFHQVDASTTRKYGGTGLGLAICKQIVGLMNGEIGAESSSGEGAQFWFTALFKKQYQAKEKVYLGHDDIKEKRILVVDDNKTNLKILVSYIENWGLICDSARNAEMAITMINTAKKNNAQYDMLISDYNMPEMDGGELGRRIKADPDTKDIKMIVLSSRGLKGDEAKMKEIGFNGYLTKPVSRHDLFNCIIISLSPEQASDIKEKEIITHYKFDEKKKKNFRVLLAEDNIVNQKLALKLIEKWGVSADAVANGLEAIESLKLIPYNLVLMDVQMPEMDGLEATVEIRKPQSNVTNSKVPIVAMTARAMKGDKQICLDAGMDDYITKPINPHKLYELLSEYLEKLE